uniref:Ankyrin repeat domain-containing protein 50-like n=1 Tax=Crassostrea virginica TaxID=6565 RepID=A0A8B8BDI8_CRAVI|nr:ankyrin repeat domain-containing protein 50-like [Crassostrea virginica]
MSELIEALTVAVLCCSYIPTSKLLRFHQWFPFVMGGAFVCISFRLIDVSAMDTRVKRSSDYGYDFNVTPVERCPMNKSEHEKAEIRMGCNENQTYHCIPDKKHSTLIEFCYPRKRSLVQSGKCLELADTGYLNNVNCENFTVGCPDTHYLSNEIYNYTACLSVAFGCFTADKACWQEKFERRPFEKFREDCEQNRTNVFLAPFIFVTIIVALQLVLVLFFCILKRRDVLDFMKGNKTSARLVSFEGGNEEQTSLMRSPHDKGTCEIKCMIPKGCDFPRSTLDLEELESEHWLEDIELLRLLRRHCLQGAFENFNYLLRTRILKRKDSLKKILESRDRDGRSLMHYAAKGGSVDILEKLMEHCSDRKLDEEDRLGHTLLHIACKYGRDDICTFLLSIEDYKGSQMNKTTKHLWNAAHFTAAGGNNKIFKILLTKKFNVDSKTSNGLNILDIACIYNHTSFCQELIKRSSELELPLNESDDRGWNIAHFAARVGNKNILEFLINGYLDVEVAKSKTHQKKTILHICCEYGHYELCKFIVENEHLNVMIGDIDQDRWNALHFCAKGGSLDAFKFIESMDIHDDETLNSKTALHISCIYKHVEIAKYLCNQLKSSGKNINDLKTKTLWTPAHYVAVEIKQDGSEEELIRILVDAGIDLTAKTEERKTVLIVACEHRNKTLVCYLVDNHPELLKIEPDLIKQAAKYDAAIREIIDNAMKNQI